MSDMTEICLADGRVALVSKEDYATLSVILWHVSSSGYVVNRKKFARDKTRNATIRMHREVMRLHGVDIPEGMEVDHINRDRLDNRFKNLRLCSRSQNLANRPYRNSTGFRGVIRTRGGRYNGQLETHKRKFYTAVFDTPEDAARARDELAKQIFGEFATLNFP